MDQFRLWRTLDAKAVPVVDGNAREATDNAELVDAFTSEHASLQFVIGQAHRKADLNVGTVYFVTVTETGKPEPGRIVDVQKRRPLGPSVWD